MGCSPPFTTRTRKSGLICCAAFALLCAVAVQATAETSVIVHTTKPYDAVVTAIEALGGAVLYQYQNVDGLAAPDPGRKVGGPPRHGRRLGGRK